MNLDQHIQEFVNKFYQAIMQFGYDGPLDTEIFKDNDTGNLYVSEYNWRSGGRIILHWVQVCILLFCGICCITT